MAWLGINYFYMDTQYHAIYHVWIQLFPTSYARGEKLGLELESNPDPLDSQGSALTTRPCHLGPVKLTLAEWCFLLEISTTPFNHPVWGENWHYVRDSIVLKHLRPWLQRSGWTCLEFKRSWLLIPLSDGLFISALFPFTGPSNKGSMKTNIPSEIYSLGETSLVCIKWVKLFQLQQANQN